jgi:hypothetical protein
MNANQSECQEQRGQSIILVAVAFLALLLFVAISVDISKGYVDRRTAQNAADGAALAGARQLAYQINYKAWTASEADTHVQSDMNDFAERNGIQDTNGVLGDTTNYNVEGYYLGEDEARLGQVGAGAVPADSWGIEAVTYITAPTFFGGIFGLDGLPLNATAAVMLEQACGAQCIVPIATHMDAFMTATVTSTNPISYCLNIYDGTGPGNFGWLNWSWQITNNPELGLLEPEECKQDDCSSQCLVQNLSPCPKNDPDCCRSGFIAVGQWVAGTTGVSSASQVRAQLEKYIGIPDDPDNPPQPFTIVVWDETYMEPTGQGCGPFPSGLHYGVRGFAKMQLLGYQLSQGLPYDPWIDPAECTNVGEVGDDPNYGNRLTAYFLGWVEGSGGECQAIGSVRAPRLSK